MALPGTMWLSTSVPTPAAYRLRDGAYLFDGGVCAQQVILQTFFGRCSRLRE